MKRYRVLVGDNSVEDRFGAWVPASIAQALYDALVMQTSLLCSVRKNYGDEDYGLWRDVNEWIANGNKAISAADGEDNG